MADLGPKLIFFHFGNSFVRCTVRAKAGRIPCMMFSFCTMNYHMVSGSAIHNWHKTSRTEQRSSRKAEDWTRVTCYDPGPCRGFYPTIPLTHWSGRCRHMIDRLDSSYQWLDRLTGATYAATWSARGAPATTEFSSSGSVGTPLPKR